VLKLLASVLIGFVLASCTTPPGGPTYQVGGRAVAGPTCPVEPAQPVPGQCDPRPVVGAQLVVTDDSGHEIVRLASDGDGAFSTSLPAGTYTLTPQPATGILGVAPPIQFTVSASDHPTALRVQYDTGIR
jgi:hypothetical protein